MIRRTTILTLACLLAGCAAPPRGQHAHFWSGRLGLQVFSEPPQSYHAAFELQGSAQAGELTLLSPLGAVMARLQWDTRQATLERNNERWQQPSVDMLTQQLIPASVPMAALFDWLEGKPTITPHWTVNLSGHADGRIQAQRLEPLPRAELRLVFDR